MNPERRSFMSSAFAWLPSMPVLSVWMARPVDASDYRHVPPRQGCKAILVKNAENARVIRWIPVTDDLPEPKRQMGGTFGYESMSATVLICGDGFVTAGKFLRCMDGSTEWGGDKKVTHWAELPAAPDEREVRS